MAFLDRWLCARGETVTEWVRAKVAEERDKDSLAERIAAVERLCSMEIELPTDPDELDRLMNPVYDPYVDDLCASPS